jgi:hypothetical protein
MTAATPGGWTDEEDVQMAQKTMMPMASGGGIGRKIVAWLVALTILAMVIHDPAGSARTIAGIVQWATGVISDLSTFGRALSEQP